MFGQELVIGVVLVFIVLAAVVVGIFLLIVKKRLEASRATALLKAGAEEPSLDLESLSKIERAIYASEVFWQDATGLIQDRVFTELNSLAENVEGFNKSLATIPRTVDKRVPRAVSMVSDAFENSASSFRQASGIFLNAAEKIASYGSNYSRYVTELQNSLAQFTRAQSGFDEQWSAILQERLSVERQIISQIIEKQKNFEMRMEDVFEQRLDAERNLIASINEKAEKIRNGRVILG